MYTTKKKITESQHSEINDWAKLYVESLTEQELSESTTDEDLLNTMFSTMLYFMTGEGQKVLKDSDWMNYLINDLNTAINKGMFKPSYEDKQRLKKIYDTQYGAEDEEI